MQKTSNPIRDDYFKQISLYKIPGDRRKLFNFVKTVALLDPTIYPILLILTEYPITDVTINRKEEGENNHTLDSYEAIMRRKLFIEQDVIGHLMDIGFDVSWSGNAFVSPSVGLKRMATCKKCGSRHKVSEFLKVKIEIDKSIPREKRDKLKKVKFTGKCPDCGYVGPLAIEETKTGDRKMVKWPIEGIDIDYTEYDDNYSYYYTPSPNLRTLLRNKNPHMIDTAEESLLYSIISRKKLVLNNVYHFRARGRSMVWPGWSLPPILSVLTTVWYMNLLVRAQEAIALDYLVPLRLLYYQNVDAEGKIKTASKKIKRTLEREIKEWRKDPNRIVTLPFPVQQLELLYGGGNLLLAPELQAAQNRIAVGLGFPPTILTGDMTYSGGSITLRMLANRFATLTASYRRYLNEFYKKHMFSPDYAKRFDLGMTKFQIADDVAKLQLLANNNLLSHTSLYEMLGIDATAEHKNKIADLQNQAQLQQEQALLANAANIATQLKGMAGQGIENPKDIEMHLYDPAQQIYKFVADYLRLPPEKQQEIAGVLEEQSPEVWAAMNEVMLANNWQGQSTYPSSGVANDAAQQQAGPQQNPQQQAGSVNTLPPSRADMTPNEAEVSRGKLNRDKIRPGEK